MEFYGVHFTLPSGVDRLPLPEVAKIEPPGRLEPLFKSLFEIYKQKTYLYQWRQNLLLEQILCEILSALHGENAPAELIRIKKVLEHIHEDPARPFTLEELTDVYKRQGIQAAVADVQQRRKPGVPLRHTVEQHHDRKNGAGKRQHDAEKDDKVVAAVQRGGFHQLEGNGGFKKRAHDDEIVRADSRWQNQRPHRIEQVQPLYDEKRGDHARCV